MISSGKLGLRFKQIEIPGFPMEGFAIDFSTIFKGRAFNDVNGAGDMDHTRSGSDILVRIDPGEEIHTTLQQLADDLGFDAAAITSGIGRTRNNQYGYMNEEGIYKKRLLAAPSELVSLSGNIARTESGESFTHIHCCWSDDDNHVHAGHMFQSTVHVVAEIHIRVMEHASMMRCPLDGLELLGLEFD